MNDIPTVDPVLRQDFLNGMSNVAATVNVVTSDGPAGRAGVTVSAMSSVSADTAKPTLLVCVHHQSPSAQKIIQNGVFCVNVLRDDQSYISDTFAGRFKTEDGDKFSCAQWTSQQTGAPRVIDPLVAFDCKIISSERVGTHHILIGEVQEVFSASRGLPLIFAKRAYRSAAPIDAAKSIDEGAARAGETLKLGCFYSFGPYLMPGLLLHLKTTRPDIEVKFVEGDQRAIVAGLTSGETELALVYDIGLDDQLETEVLTELTPYVLLPEKHHLAEKSEITVAELVDEPLILLDTPPSRDYFLSVFEAENLTPRIKHTSVMLEMVRGLVGHGHGYSLLVTRPAHPTTYDGRNLITRKLVTDIPPSRVVLAQRKGNVRSKAAVAFAEACRQHIGV